jgi:DNA modification methylase
MRPYYAQDDVLIFHGDCREIIPALTPIDLVVTSPPYPGRRTYAARQKNTAWDDLVPPALAAIELSDQGQALVNLGIVTVRGEVQQYWDTLISAMRTKGKKLAGWGVWDKGIGTPGVFRSFSPSHEFVFHFANNPASPLSWVPCARAGRKRTGTATRNPDDSVGKKRYGLGTLVPATRPARSVFTIGSINGAERRQNDHPARFPVALASGLIQCWPGLVLDPFMGSGTTLVAAMRLGRCAIGIELEERFCEIAANRLDLETETI